MKLEKALIAAVIAISATQIHAQDYEQEAWEFIERYVSKDCRALMVINSLAMGYGKNTTLQEQWAMTDGYMKDGFALQHKELVEQFKKDERPSSYEFSMKQIGMCAKVIIMGFLGMSEVMN